MKPLVVDTSVWVEWIRGRMHELMPVARDRIVYMPAPVEMELLSGIRTARDQRILDGLLSPYVRHGRFIVPGREDFRRAGEVLADARLPASLHGNDALICVCARNIGAEIWTLNKKDFIPLAKALQVTLGPA